MSMEFARAEAANAWTTEETKGIEMDSRLAEAFAVIIERLTSQPQLGCATTGELLSELVARAEVDGSIDYKTVGED